MKTKAQYETDPFNKYLSIFIAYNIFYNLFKKSENPNADLTYGDNLRAIETQSLMDSKKILRQLKGKWQKYLHFIPIYREEFWGRKKKVPIYKTLIAALNEGNDERTVEMLLKWLYKVRCNLVHGEKNYDDEKQKILLEQSSFLLKSILTHALDSYCQLYVHGPRQVVFSE